MTANRGHSAPLNNAAPHGRAGTPAPYNPAPQRPNAPPFPPAPSAQQASPYSPQAQNQQQWTAPVGQNPYSAAPQPAPGNSPNSAQSPQMSGYGDAITPVSGQFENPVKSSLLSRITEASTSGGTAISGKKKGFPRIFLFIALAFLFFFVLISGAVILQSERADKAVGLAEIKQDLTDKAGIVSERFGQAVRWQDMALSTRGSASQIVSFAARAPNVIGVAVLDAQGRVLSHYPAQAKALSAAPRDNIADGGVRIDGLPGQGGSVSPLIIRKFGDTYLVSQYAPGSFLGQEPETASSAIISRSGGIIDATQRVAGRGVADSFSLSTRGVENLTTIEKGVGTTPLPGQDIAAFGRIPNTDLTLIRNMGAASVGIPAPIWPFVLLFIMTTAMVFALLRRLSKELQSEEEAHSETHRMQTRFRQAVESGRGGVFEIDLQHQNVYINDELAENLGLPRADAQLTMSQFLGLIHAEDRERFLSASRRAAMQGGFDLDARPSAKALVLQFRGRVTTTADGISNVLSGVVTDITEQRGAQTRLQLAEARLHDALNSMTNSFVIWDRMRRLVLWNGKFEEFFGFATGALRQGMDQSAVEQMAHGQIENIYQPDTELENQGDIVEIKLKDGRWVRYAEAATADGGQVSIGNDVTEIRTREEQLRSNDIALRNTVDVLRKSQARIMELADNYEQEKIRAEQASQSKSDFLANMSHELRTPLNAINGFSDIMKREMFGPLGDPRYKEYVSDILFSGQHLLSLINDILDMSKIEAGKMSLNTDMLSISDMISQVVRILRGRAEDSKLKLIYDQEPIKDIEADPRAVKQVLLNLMTNAIKFTPEGGTVKVSVEEKSAGLILRVSDSGIGISQEDIERLAKPFEQVDKAASKQTEGTGLGLALSKSLVELHGGNFQITSEVGKGTTVIFTLPNRPPEMEAKPADREVGDEITRLAADIATVLEQNPETPTTAPPPQNVIEPAAAEHPAAPMPAASDSHQLPPPPMAARG